MAEHKEIKDMSFEEFFGKSDDEARAKADKIAHGDKQKAPQNIHSGFDGSSPKINYRDGRFYLSVPRYKGKGPFNAAVDCSLGIIPISPLDSVKIREGRMTRPASIDITALGLTPFDSFILTIDGANAYENAQSNLILFNSAGSPVSKAYGETVAVYPKGTPIKLEKASLLRSDTIDKITIAHYDVAEGGSISAGSEEAPKKAEPEAVPKPKAKKAPAAKPGGDKEQKKPESAPAPAPKKRAKKTLAKASLGLSDGLKDASISVAGEIIPLYSSFPFPSALVEGCEPAECTICVADAAGEIVYGRLPVESGRMELRSGRAEGLLTVSVEKDGKAIASAKYYLIPDFACEYSGKGDIPEDTTVKFTMFGESYAKDIYDDDFEGPYYNGDEAFNILWSVPVVTYDIGEGHRPYEPLSFDADELTSDMLVVKVRGAKKKKLYFGQENGKKEDITTVWDTDSVQINLVPLLDQVYASSVAYCFFLSVNSFPNRKFITIRNPEYVRAEAKDGKIFIEARGSRADYVCNIYRLDKSCDSIPVSEGSTEIPIPDDAVEAEVVEIFRGNARRAHRILVRPLPFVSRQAGDIWLYVSKDKRIPIPSALLKGEEPDMAEVEKWHKKIVSMNAELKTVSLKDMKAAFASFKS